MPPRSLSLRQLNPELLQGRRRRRGLLPALRAAWEFLCTLVALRPGP